MACAKKGLKPWHQQELYGLIKILTMIKGHKVTFFKEQFTQKWKLFQRHADGKSGKVFSALKIFLELQQKAFRHSPK